MDATTIVSTVEQTTTALGVARADIPILAFGVSVAAWLHFFIIYYRTKIKCPGLDCTEIQNTRGKMDTVLLKIEEIESRSTVVKALFKKIEKLEEKSIINSQVHTELLKTLQDLRIEVAILSGVSSSAFNMQKPRRPIGESRENFNNLRGDDNV